ncbi:hypothetical protein BJ980_001227 [Nocardioides daedukensis]|uniref:N-acetylmuramoyl-L-alanine amidase n=1 Tax=Nocardioides daedukensis TaxID=634462 RepID=A0A7Y9UTI3_9ACTN|nr:peptidoglycan recognition protein [Nocardioides daedukensis]NYG58304.1 hypothetical protein [Nocardioides daedukensis]
MSRAHLSVLTLAASILVAPLLVGGLPQAAAERPQVELKREAGTPLSSAEVKLPTRRTVTTDRFTMVAATWAGEDPGVEVRTRTEGRWTGWVELESLADGPSSGEGNEAPDGASDLIWVGDSDRLQVRTERTADDLEMVLINPGVAAADDDPVPPAPAPESPGVESPETTDQTPTVTTSATRRTVPRPTIYSRKQWGADESWKNGSPRYTDMMKQVHVHHTVNANDYRSWQTAGILRGIYRYHTKTLGWFDIGYNFLVDRFGRIWEGRSGGVGNLVQGAHTLGFNHNSVGVAVIGNYETRTASRTVLRALADISAWKFDRGNRYPVGKIWMTSTGSDKFPKGKSVYLYKVDGHRNTNDTSCPGRYLYAELPKLRNMIYHRMYS